MKANIRLPNITVPIVRLINIGLGPATDINIEWKFKNPALGSIIKKSEIMKKYEIKLSKNSFIISQQIGSSGNIVKMLWADSSSTILDYCLPSSHNDSERCINFPNGIVSNYIIRLLALKRPAFPSTITLENILLTVTYVSVDAKVHTNEFVIESKISYLPDYVQSPSNPIDKVHYSLDNIRGEITFSVKNTNKSSLLFFPQWGSTTETAKLPSTFRFDQANCGSQGTVFLSFWELIEEL